MYQKILMSVKVRFLNTKFGVDHVAVNRGWCKSVVGFYLAYFIEHILFQIWLLEGCLYRLHLLDLMVTKCKNIIYLSITNNLVANKLSTMSLKINNMIDKSLCYIIK